ncbi:hypothetical protein K474DRAFT_1558022, partial [Panus rudis PR-1116 ss-1]
MYYDKRFQMDPMFPLIAFNHEQIKRSTTGGFLLAERQNFDDVANRLFTLNDDTLTHIIEQLQKQGHYKPETEQEKECYRILNDLDFVDAHVDGSVTNRKRMRNEIWALTSYLGAPSWFITFSPADVNHPIALYFADTNQACFPSFRSYDERIRLIAHNPVAGARFFKMMVELFLKHVLKWNQNTPGLYGDTSGYYGTVEQ